MANKLVHIEFLVIAVVFVSQIPVILLIFVRNAAHSTIGTLISLSLTFFVLLLLIFWSCWCLIDPVNFIDGANRSHLGVHIFYLLW